MDSKITTPPGRIAAPTVRLAAISAVRSGRFSASMGVGTVTMKTLQPARRAGSVVKLRLSVDPRVSGVTSSVRSRPAFSSATRSALRSKPTTAWPAAKATASGRPT